jgi:thiamine biosynthesis lipoprotein ApbE
LKKHNYAYSISWKLYDRKVTEIIKKNNSTDDEIKELNKYAGKIKGIFLADNVKDFIDRLNKFYKKWNKVPHDLKLFFNKKIVRDMQKLTQHLFDPQVPRTNNLLEGKFSSTQQTSDKKKIQNQKRMLIIFKTYHRTTKRRIKKSIITAKKIINMKLEKSNNPYFKR